MIDMHSAGIDIIVDVVMLVDGSGHISQALQNHCPHATAQPPPKVLQMAMLQLALEVSNVDVKAMLPLVVVRLSVLVVVKGHALQDVQNHCWHAMNQPPDIAAHSRDQQPAKKLVLVLLVVVVMVRHSLQDLQNHCWHPCTQPPAKVAHAGDQQSLIVVVVVLVVTGHVGQEAQNDCPHA